MDLGFTDVKEVYNRADADIIARLDYNNMVDFNQKFQNLIDKTKGKITQISYDG